jgi:mitochondrial inner membrane protease subunit 1
MSRLPARPSKAINLSSKPRIPTSTTSPLRIPQSSTTPVKTPSSTKLSPSLFSRLRPYFLLATSFYCAGTLITNHVIHIYPNTGPSMAPTVSSSGSTYTITGLWYAGGRGIKLGDIVQVRHPMFPRMLAGKRVVGMPGDFVVRGWDGEGGVGGKKASRGLVDGDEEEKQEEPEMVQVPEGHVWLNGDNLAWSRDSRMYGAVPMALITGKSLWLVDGYWPGSWRAVWRDQLVTVEEGDVG